jgi:hypothetical protein
MDGVSLCYGHHGSKRGQGHYRHHKLAHFSLLLNFYGGATTLGLCTTSLRDDSGALSEKNRGGRPDISTATKNNFGNKPAAIVVTIRMSWALCRQHVRRRSPATLVIGEHWHQGPKGFGGSLRREVGRHRQAVIHRHCAAKGEKPYFQVSRRDIKRRFLNIANADTYLKRNCRVPFDRLAA